MLLNISHNDIVGFHSMIFGKKEPSGANACEVIVTAPPLSMLGSSDHLPVRVLHLTELMVRGQPPRSYDLDTRKAMSGPTLEIYGSRQPK